MLALVLPLTFGWGGSSVIAQAQETVRVGVLSFRSLETTHGDFAPTAAWLEAQVPGYRFEIVPLYFRELTDAVVRRQVSFVLTNPQHFVLLHADHGLTALATLMPLADGHPVSHFGGVVFTRAERGDIRRLNDLRGKRISAVSQESMGGYLAQRWSLFKAGVDTRRDLAMHFTGMPHDNVIREVLSGKADAGFVRTGVLERSIQLGEIQRQAVKIINLRAETAFPQWLSTDLYPEWAFAALSHVSPDLQKAVAVALLNLTPGTGPAPQGGYYGFAPPVSYSEVEALMVRLGMHPYRQVFGWRDVFDKYAVWFVGLLGLIVLGTALAASRLRRGNQALNAALEASRELAQERTQLLASIGEGVYGIDQAGLCTFINPVAQSMLGYRAEEVLGQDQHRLFHHSKADGSAYPHEECPIHLTLKDGVRRQLDETFIRKNGELFPVHLTVTPVTQAETTVGAVVVFQDVTQERLRQRHTQLLETAVQSAANSVVITNPAGEIEWINPATTRLTGYSLGEVMGQNPRFLKSGSHDTTFYKDLWETIQAGRVWHGELLNRRKDGSLYHEEMTITPVRDEGGQIQHYVAIKQDVTERKRLEEELRHLATTDSLTGIANRRHFLDLLHQEVRRLNRYGGNSALLMLDIDHFKRINDTWGHAVGDRVLRHLTGVLGQHLRKTDSLGRLGGEEFAILLPSTSMAGAGEFAERLRRQIATQPITTDKGEVTLTISIGIAQLEETDSTPDAVLVRADAALYRAKELGRNRVEE